MALDRVAFTSPATSTLSLIRYCGNQEFAAPLDFGCGSREVSNKGSQIRHQVRNWESRSRVWYSGITRYPVSLLDGVPYYHCIAYPFYLCSSVSFIRCHGYPVYPAILCSC